MSLVKKDAPEIVKDGSDFADDDSSIRFSMLELDPLPPPPVSTASGTKAKPSPAPAQGAAKLKLVPKRDQDVAPAPIAKDVSPAHTWGESDTEKLLETSMERCLDRVNDLIARFSDDYPDGFVDWRSSEYHRQEFRPILDALETYERIRRDLFRTRLDKLGQEWCSLGQHAVPRECTKRFLENGPIELVRESGWSSEMVYHACPDCLKETLQRQLQDEWSGEPVVFHRIVPVYQENSKLFCMDVDGRRIVYGSYGQSSYESDMVPAAALSILNIPPRIVLCMHDGRLELEEVSENRHGTYIYL